MKISINTDGGARGNPGLAGYGLVVCSLDDKIIYQESKFLGIKTNNEAEYMGLVAALTWLQNNYSQYNIDYVNFNSDSQLMVRQMQGLYKVKAPNLIGFYTTAKKIITSIPITVKFKDIRREYNKLADQLANDAMDQK